MDPRRTTRWLKRLAATALAGLTAVAPMTAAWASTVRDVEITVANNLDEPAQPAQPNEGVLKVECGTTAFAKIEREASGTLTCSAAEGVEAVLSWQAGAEVGDVYVDCRSSASLAFSGGGASVTYTLSCTDPDDGDDDAAGDGDPAGEDDPT